MKMILFFNEKEIGDCEGGYNHPQIKIMINR